MPVLSDYTRGTTHRVGNSVWQTVLPISFSSDLGSALLNGNRTELEMGYGDHEVGDPLINKAHRGEEDVVYPGRRWLVLFAFCVNTFLNAFMFMNYASVSNVFMHTSLSFCKSCL